MTQTTSEDAYMIACIHVVYQRDTSVLFESEAHALSMQLMRDLKLISLTRSLNEHNAETGRI